MNITRVPSIALGMARGECIHSGGGGSFSLTHDLIGCIIILDLEHL